MPRRTRFAGSSRDALRVTALLVACAVALPSCGGGSGKPKKKQVILATEYDDRRVGRDAAAEVEAEMGIFQDPALSAYVHEIGKRLIRFTPMSAFNYRFRIVDQAMPNAFALPGGQIYVSRGLLALASNEDELACVIGHEITHAAERHAAAQQEMSRRGLPIVSPYMRMAKLAAYGRDQERDADRGGQMLAAAAGYDPMGMSTFLRKLGNTERLALGYSRLPGYFDTHPGPTERSATSANRAANMNWRRNPELQPGLAAYLKRINGIVLGTNPSEGIFEGNLFLHPDMNFQLRFPGGWNVFNTHSAVGAMPPSGDAIIVLETSPPADTAEEAAKLFLEKNTEEMQIRVDRQQPVQIGEIAAYRIEGGAVIQGQRAHAHFTIIPYQGIVFRISSFSESGKGDKYVARSRNTARSFAPLGKAEAEAVEVVRLRVVTAEEGETLATLSKRAGNTFGAGETAVLNGVFTDERFKDGDLVKVAQSEPYRGGGRRSTKE